MRGCRTLIEAVRRRGERGELFEGAAPHFAGLVNPHVWWWRFFGSSGRIQKDVPARQPLFTPSVMVAKKAAAKKASPAKKAAPVAEAPAPDAEPAPAAPAKKTAAPKKTAPTKKPAAKKATTAKKAAPKKAAAKK